MTRPSLRPLAAFVFCLGCADPEAATENAADPAPIEAEPTDTSAPTFPADAPLIATASGRLGDAARPVVLRWEAATDDEEVIAYVVRVDGEEVARVSAPAVETTIEEVTFERAHTFTVVAVDAAENESSPLTTADALAPWFPEGAALEGRVDGDRLTLSWPAAEDDVGVTAYSIQSGEDEIASVAPDAREHRLHLDPERPVARLSIVAMDAAGHKTRIAGGPELQRALAQRSVERAQAQVEQMLLGALGDGPRYEDVLAGGPVTGNAADLLAEAEGVGVASSWEPEAGGGGRVGSAIGELQLPPPQETRRRGRVTIGGLDEERGPGRFDRSVAARQLRARQRAIQTCYERVLRSEPTVAGRIEAQFTIVERGSVENAIALENTTGSAGAASCVTNTVRRFRFNPGPEGGSVTYTVPITLAPAE